MPLRASEAIRKANTYNSEIHDDLNPYLEKILTIIDIYSENGHYYCKAKLDFFVLEPLNKKQIVLVINELRRLGYLIEQEKNHLKITWIKERTLVSN
ncbi:MAG: hypothetical protein K2Q15_07645 [Burkholderiales bacterium]|nr:hypothetical protein [Burkholderiales bacterium]